MPTIQPPKFFNKNENPDIEETLPIGWEERRASDGETYYYVDLIDEVASWDRPAESDYPNRTLDDLEPLPYGWESWQDIYNDVRYINRFTNAETSRRPQEKGYIEKIEEPLPKGWEKREDLNGQEWWFDLVTNAERSTRPKLSDFAEKLIEEALPAAWVKKVEIKEGVFYEDLVTGTKTRKRPKDGDFPRIIPPEPLPTRDIPRPYRFPSREAQRLNPSFSHLFEYTNRSGLTPPGSMSPKAPLGPESDAREQPFRNYVRDELLGFSLEELHDTMGIDAYEVGVGENTLTNEILPLLKDNWENPGKKMKGKPGRFWDMNDPEVSVVMQPILKLVSRFIISFETNDWWDALLEGRRDPIDPNRVPPGTSEQLRSFKRRTPQEKLSNPANWSSLNGRIDFAFHEGYFPDDSEAQMSLVYGVTFSHSNGKTFPRLTLAHSVIEALMPSFVPKLSSSERLRYTFVAAITLLHELAHAVEATRLADRQAFKMDPYFENESVSEGGHSMENAIFGGRMDQFPEIVREESFLGVKAQGLLCGSRRSLTVFISPWPNWLILEEETEQQDQGQGNNSVLLLDKSPENSPNFPITLAYIEDIQQDAFWDTQVAQFGGQQLKVWDRIFGHVNRKSMGHRRITDCRNAIVTSRWFDSKKWQQSTNPPSTVPNPSTPNPPAPIPICVISAPNPDSNAGLNPSGSIQFGRKYGQKRARESRRIARAVQARLDNKEARADFYKKIKTPLILQAVERIQLENRQKKKEYKEFYKDEDEIDDIMRSKGVLVGDLGIRDESKVTDTTDPDTADADP